MPEVLVVDDSPAERFKCKELLESLGYEVVEAENGRDGVAMANQELPDVVLMDIVMPGMKGFQATRQICRGEKRVIFPSSSSAVRTRRPIRSGAAVRVLRAISLNP